MLLVEPLLVISDDTAIDSMQSMSAYLAPGRHKHQDRLQGGVGLDGSISWLVHGGHAGAVKLARVALNVAFQRHRPYTWLEVE